MESNPPLDDRDWITSTHRGHGHYLAKGGEPKALFAEIYERVGGICRGFGGTMHVADFSKGIVGANFIVGAAFPSPPAPRYRHSSRMMAA